MARRGEVRLEIERMLAEYDRLTEALPERRVVGFRKKVAKKFGVSKQRVTNIARELGMTRPHAKGQGPGVQIDQEASDGTKK